MIDILGDRALDLPATYQNELFRARGHNGVLSFGSKVLPDWAIKLFGYRLRYNLQQNGCTWGQDLVFLHEIRGVKNSIFHPHGEPDVADAALKDFLQQNGLRYESLIEHEWYIDVALEISSGEGKCLGWLTNQHSTLLQELAGIDANVADRITSLGSSHYARDITSHMPAISGCRITPGPTSRGPFDIRYIQLYTTDKGLTYRPDKGHYGKFLTVPDILYGRGKTYLQELFELYHQSARNNLASARIEFRLPLRNANSVLLSFTDQAVYSSLAAFEVDAWW